MLTSTPAAEPRRHLTFESRVAAQESLEGVRLRHLTPPAPRRAAGDIRDAATTKVGDYLAETVALERRWGVRITARMLRAEAERIARDSKMPDRLREMYAAIGDDPVAFQECVARRTLVERLIRTRYAYDAELHAGARRRAARARDELAAGRSVRARGGETQETLLLRSDAGPDDDGVARVDGDELRRLRDRLHGPQARRAQIEETRGAIVVRSPLRETRDGLEVAVLTIPKTSFEGWWREKRSEYVGSPVETVASAEPIAFPSTPGAGAVETVPCEGEGWRRASIDGPPDARTQHATVWTGTEMIVWGGSVAAYDPFALDSGARYDPATDSWAPVSRVGAPSPRSQPTAVWTGTEMIVWGGLGPNYEYFDGGARYDPVSDTWAPISRLGAPVARYGHTAVWTGSEMIVWGGHLQFGSEETPDARYDPATDTWTPMSLGDAPSPRFLHTAIWTGSEMIVWGGEAESGQLLRDGGRYDPRADVWHPLPVDAAPLARANHTAVWTGDRMLVWGGDRAGFQSHGASYDPATNSWRPMADSGYRDQRIGHAAVWTGSRMIVLGGDRAFSLYDFYATVYDPGSDTWATMPNPDLGVGRTGLSAIWTGGELIVWGGGDPAVNIGARYDPETRTWTPLAESGGPLARTNGTSVWTGNEWLFWAGNPYNLYGNITWTGDRFDAALGTWSPINPLGAPEPRDRHVAVWTGSEMVVWGGQALSPPGRLATGGRYDPLSDSWKAMSTAGAPTPRTSAMAVWSGAEMIVWGGFAAGGATSSGGRYDPATDLWRPTSTVNAPAPRFRAAAAWAGSVMTVWGGNNLDFEFLGDGGRYDPASDVWATTSTDGAPAGRRDFILASTGDRLIVWGGQGAETTLASGAVYDPSADQWTPISSTGAPQQRSSPSSVWNGRELLVWGGRDDSDPNAFRGEILDSGARYDPEADVWIPMSDLGRPLGRYLAPATWTGSEMIVWGGYSITPLNNGGAYALCPPGHPPTAVAGPDRTLECTGALGASTRLDGTASSDADSTPGTNDDIASYRWSEGSATLATDVIATVPFPLGDHEVTLTVTDLSGAEGTDDLAVRVEDTMPPSGAVVAPIPGACFGPVAIPVRITDDVEDLCDAAPARSYEPGPGPAYAAHGDHVVTLTARDASGNTTRSTTSFTIDIVPPLVTFTAPPGGGLRLPGALPLSIAFTSSDDDGAAGGVVHESLSLQGCTVYDGATYGNADGRLSDETIVLSGAEMCRIASMCGFTELVEPELRVDATDCGGNTGTASVRIPGRIPLDPKSCSSRVVPRAHRVAKPALSPRMER